MNIGLNLNLHEILVFTIIHDLLIIFRRIDGLFTLLSQTMTMYMMLLGAQRIRLYLLLLMAQAA